MGHMALAVSPSTRRFAYHKGFFLFSRLDSAKPDDGNFRSGLAVKKGTRDIYRWEEEENH